MPTHRRIAAATFRQYTTYRAATLAGVFTNSVFGLIRASIMLSAVHAAGGQLRGYDAAHAATYVWLSQGLLAPVETFGTREVGERVHQGDIAVDLLRPVDPLGMYYAQKLGRAGYLLLARGIPPLVVGAVVTGITLTRNPWSYVLGAVAVMLAITVSFLADLLVNLAAFWITQTRGLSVVYIAVSQLLSGFLVPIAWFPGWLLALSRATPFPAMVQTPIDTLSGRVPPGTAATAVGVQAAWCLGFAVVAVAMLRAGSRTLEVQGG